MSIREVQVQRVSVVTTQPFDTVVARIDKQIGHPDMAAFRKSLSAAQNEAEMKKVVDPVTQPNGIMEFIRFDLGDVLTLIEQAQEAFDHPEPGAQHRHDHDLLGEPSAAGRFEWCLDLHVVDQQLTCRFDRKDRGAVEQRPAEAGKRGVPVPQDGQPVGQDGVLDERQLGRQRG